MLSLLASQENSADTCMKQRLSAIAADLEAAQGAMAPAYCSVLPTGTAYLHPCDLHTAQRQLACHCTCILHAICCADMAVTCQLIAQHSIKDLGKGLETALTVCTELPEECCQVCSTSTSGHGYCMCMVTSCSSLH